MILCTPVGWLESMSEFGRHIGIDYSSAEMPTASLKGLRVYLAPRGCAAG
jgi:hypothetical protein